MQNKISRPKHNTRSATHAAIRFHAQDKKRRAVQRVASTGISSHLHWYWQSYQNNKETKKDNRTHIWASEKQTQLETKASSRAGQCIPAGCRVTIPRRVLITMSVITMRSIFRKLCVQLFTLCKISTNPSCIQPLKKDLGKFTSCMTFGAHKLVHSEPF